MNKSLFKQFIQNLQNEVFKADLFVPGDKTGNTKIVQKYLTALKTYRDSKMFNQEKALSELFKNYLSNTSLQNVLLKVSCLNDFYSTGIIDTYSVAKTIFDLDVDSKLAAGDLSLVNKISSETKEKCESKRREYSFASKFCSFQKPEIYPIYDSRNEIILNYYKNEIKIVSNKIESDYCEYVKVINEYKTVFALDSFSYKEIDRFNWMFVNTVLDKFTKNA
jgi:hypothetical protein